MNKNISMLFCIIIILYISFNGSSSYGYIMNGDFREGLAGWEVSGDVSASEDGAVILRTGGIHGPYMTTVSTEFIVSGSILSFKYSFEYAGPDLIKDPDYPSFGPDFFQMTLNSIDGNSLDIPIAWSPTDGFQPFSIDIANFAETGTGATLTFILFDEDDSHLSIAVIDDVSNTVVPAPEAGTLLLLGGGLVGLYICSRYRKFLSRLKPAGLLRPLLPLAAGCLIPIASIHSVWAELIEVNVDEMITLEYSAPVFNTRTHILTLNMTATNVSDQTVFSPLEVIVTGISHPDVKVADPDSYTADGLPVWDLTLREDRQALLPGDKTSTRKISFYNPGRIKFRWDQDIKAMMDMTAETGPVIYNICLVPGERPPLCEFYYDDPEIRNPEFALKLEKPLPEMYLYQQVRVYAYDNEEIPFRVTVNGADASYKKEGFYYFSNLLLNEGMNTLVIAATNEKGVTASREIPLLIDATPPVIDVLWPAGNSIVSESDQLISGTVDDPFVSKITLTIDFMHREDVPVPDGTFSKRMTLQPGHNHISLSAADEAGNSTYNFYDVIYVHSETGDITGSIYSSILGLPLAGVTVSVVSSDDSGIKCVSDNNGNYKIAGVRSGDLTLRFDKEGYYPVELSVLSLGGPEPQRQDIALTPVNDLHTLTMTGRITDTGGSPLEGVILSIAGTPLHGYSDHNGIYLISGIPRNSFTAEADHVNYEKVMLDIPGHVYGNTITILTHNFILKDKVSPISIIYPLEGEAVSGDSITVTGIYRGDEEAFGIRVNGILAWNHGGFFLANDVPVDRNDPRITAEVIGPSGTQYNYSRRLVQSTAGNGTAEIHSQEAGLVPGLIPFEIELLPGVTVTEYDWRITGPAPAVMISDGPLQHTVTFSDAGVYVLQYMATDTTGRHYEGEIGFMGLSKAEIEEDLQNIWRRLKDALISGQVENALILLSPQTRARYTEQFNLLQDDLPEIFSNLGEIELVTLKDDIAKTRIHLGDKTHYIWFSRDIYGLWNINKF